MFSCRCTQPWLPASTCAAHQTAPPGRRTVALGLPTQPQLANMSSGRKYSALLGRRCRSCNAALTGLYDNHVCTRHPTEPEETPTPWD